MIGGKHMSVRSLAPGDRTEPSREKILRLALAVLLAVVAGVVVFGMGSPPAGRAPAPSAAPYAPGEVLLKLADPLALSPDARVAGLPDGPGSGATDNRQQLEQLLATMGAFEATSLGPHGHTYQVRFAGRADAALLAQHIAANPLVVFAEPNSTRELLRMPNDPRAGDQWALQSIQAPAAWDITTGSDVVVAVIDTGVSSTHPELAGKTLPGYNAILNNDQSEDDNGHGTAVASLIAANTDNGEGIAGVCWGCVVLPVKVLSEAGTGRDDDLVRGIYWAADHGANVINMSLGGARDSRALRDAIAYAYNRGVVIVGASGNDHHLGNDTLYPAAYDNVIAVGGVGPEDGMLSFSTTGNHLDITAPGLDLLSVSLDEGYTTLSGTSFSSCFGSGVSGLILSLRGDLPPADVRCILQASADDRGAPGKDPEYGWGRVNALRAVQMAQSYTTCPLNAPPPSPEQPGTLQPMADPATAFARVPAAPVPEGVVYFPETGHRVGEPFLSYWQRNGGLEVLGLPISEAFVMADESGATYTVQYFERHRLEFHPEQPEPYHIQLARLGDRVLQVQGRNWFTFNKGVPAPGCHFFNETGHSLCGAFLSYWSSHGLELDGRPGTSFEESLALFGQPLSEPQVEEVAPGVYVTVQWFERARFEEHSGIGVLLGLLGNELARAEGWLPQ
jgi:subtilisin family serine protease